MQQPSQPDNETRDKILHTAARLFLERGFAKTKVIDIARAAGITPATMYWHFESKGELLFEYLKANLEEFNARLEAAVSGVEDPVHRLRTIAIAHTAVQLNFRDQAKVVLNMTRASADLIAALPSDKTAEIEDLLRAYLNMVRQTVRLGIESNVFHTPDVNALTFAVVNMCETTPLWFKPEGALSVDEAAAANGEFAVRMATGRGDIT
ncbi:TetR/AcrR family transcriptional regulator [Leucobacter chinensis]|uniref:TetR/AcrR family transcriptional regulator n=1 Tax=Leucobacter chinensis TaxID=2851010 RepID=UPI001C250127|nr:TetR family transcriptional regulator [Leucobacter chinensis]